jgi:hypothetical protein
MYAHATLKNYLKDRMWEEPGAVWLLSLASVMSDFLEVVRIPALVFMVE